LDPGEYDIYLKISDPKETTVNKRSIRFANKGDNWDESIGANKIGSTSLRMEVGVNAAEKTAYGDKVEYTFSAANMATVNLIELTFEVSASILSNADAVLTGLNGFTVFDGPNWTNSGDGKLQCHAVLGIYTEQTKSGAMDVAKLSLDAKKLGNATLSLTGVNVYGIDMVNGKAQSSKRLAIAEPSSATTKVFSIYDLDDDGVVDYVDLSLAFFYYQARLGDPNWDDAKVADVTGSDGKPDGKVDMLDLLAIYANFID
jgi:hypothetical protein